MTVYFDRYLFNGILYYIKKETVCTIVATKLTISYMDSSSTVLDASNIHHQDAISPPKMRTLSDNLRSRDQLISANRMIAISELLP